MPSVLACDHCGTYETPLMYFDTMEGRIYCENCPKAGAVPVPKKCCYGDTLYLFNRADKNIQLQPQRRKHFASRQHC